MEQAFRIKRASWIGEIGIPVLILALIFGAVGAVFGEMSLRFILACVFLAASAAHGLFWMRLKKDYRYATHVAIDHDGQMAVRISERDYSRYQQEFTFDRLCAALGNLIVDFLEMYRNGKSSEIIERMDVLKFLV